MDPRRTVAAQAELTKGDVVYVGPFTLVSVSPNYGVHSGGQEINITCTNLNPDGAYTVTCAGVACSGVSVEDATHLLCITGAGMATDDSIQSDIVVSDGAPQTLAASFAVLPALISISPTTGTNHTVDSYVVTTTGLIDRSIAEDVFLHTGAPGTGTPADPYSYVSDTEFDCDFDNDSGVYKLTMNWNIGAGVYFTNTLNAAITVP